MGNEISWSRALISSIALMSVSLILSLVVAATRSLASPVRSGPSTPGNYNCQSTSGSDISLLTGKGTRIAAPVQQVLEAASKEPDPFQLHQLFIGSLVHYFRFLLTRPNDLP
jgi:hypothetical protein